MCHVYKSKVKKNEFYLENKPINSRPNGFGSDNLLILFDDDPAESLSELVEKIHMDDQSVLRRFKYTCNL